MTCPYTPRLDDVIDGTLSPADRTAFDAHLPGCPTCRTALDDRRHLLTTARMLERHVPSPAVWDNLSRATAPSTSARVSGWRLLAAAAVLALLTGGVWTLGTRLLSLAPATSVASVEQPPVDPALLESVESQLQLAEEHYANAIAGLDALAKAEDAALDAETVDVLQANLSVIDTAIDQSRQALTANPANAVARDSLFSALRSKVSLLQSTLALINEMRKGNQDGAARIVSGMQP